MQELEKWQYRFSCNLKELQSLVGKLHFVCTVVRPGRLFMARMLNCLRGIPPGDRIMLSEEFHLDVQWWLKFLPTFGGTSIMWMYHITKPDGMVASDACLNGMGAVKDTEFIKLEFPDSWKNSNIAHLELLAVIVMCKTWSEELSGKSIVIKCDNESVCSVLNSGKARDAVLLKLMREMVFVAVNSTFEFKALHVRSKCNVLPDLLSRWQEGTRVRQKFYELVKGKGFIERNVAHDVFTFSHTW